jgi:OOP family OmpA-OmpF porin
MMRGMLSGALVLLTVSLSYAGWLSDAVKSAGESLGRRAVDETATGTYDKAKEGTKDVINQKGQPPDSKPAVRGQGESAASSANQPTASGEVTMENAETVYSKYDFIPGDKMIFFDDFSDTDVGEFPRKWHLNGPKGGTNAVEVVEYQGKRFLRSAPAGKGMAQRDSTQYVRLNQKGDLPERFTIEFDAILAPHSPGSAYHTYYCLKLFNKDDGFTNSAPNNPGVLVLSGAHSQSANTESNIDKSDGKLHHVAVSVNGPFVKAYIDNVRVINDPDGAKRPITLVGLTMWMGSGLPSDKVMFTNFRLAEGGKTIRSALETDGKIITHGILFDTGKDVIRPESLPTLKSILVILSENPGLNFSIEGHTDNQGDKAINQPLSEKRAAAVKTWLVGKAIAPERLKINGFGDTKPIDSNATLEGRANNRRVEFVKF